MEWLVALFFLFIAVDHHFADTPAMDVYAETLAGNLDEHTIYEVEEGFLFHDRIYRNERHAVLAQLHHKHEGQNDE